jgi:hypothetical protein
MVTLEECLEFWKLLKSSGFEGDLVGGAYKGKAKIHDLDLLCYTGDLESNIELVRGIKLSYNFTTPIELYSCSWDMYDGLKKALRATTYESIRERLMKGLRFKKVKL